MVARETVVTGDLTSGPSDEVHSEGTSVMPEASESGKRSNRASIPFNSLPSLITSGGNIGPQAALTII